jgi:ATP-dependent DNA helicase UvrD/PcrA
VTGVAAIADLHIHSKYSRACSRDCDLEHLAWWAGRKGIAVVGTGDFTHPAWFEELTSTLVPAEPGLFRLRDDAEHEIAQCLPPSCRRPVRFMLSVEISTIYKRADRTRKVHHLVYAPDFDTVRRFNKALGRIGNIASDGRPILGLDSRDLLEITLESGPDAYLVPAHIWTPWFAALGSMSGFDAVSDCYADLAEHVFAVETGLSSDPGMNWRVSGLDPYRLVSNSDAHSPPILGREATVFDTDLDYFAIRRALETGEGFGGTIEFFPEEGKYHLDGHRKCGVRLEPGQTRERHGSCPGCGKPLTVGVLHRVEELADRADGIRPAGAAPFRSLVPLPEIVGEVLGVGARSKTVARQVTDLVTELGPELDILQTVPIDELRATPLIGEAIARLRDGRVLREAGYDGEYGVIRMFAPDELRGPATAALFALDAPLPRPAPIPEPLIERASPALDGLDAEQQAATARAGPLLIVAGPGTGKTRTLTHRLAHLVGERGVAPERCLAVTFTRRACEELRERLQALVPDAAPRITVTTFHSLGLRIIRDHHAALGLPDGVRVGDDVDFDDLITLPVRLLDADPAIVRVYRERWTHICVDEYQDVDDGQYALLRHLAPPDGDLCAIGDPDQAIYGFRGGDVGFFLRFGRDFPAAATISLTRNYRSTPIIVRAALSAIEPASLVPGRVLHAHAHGDDPVVVAETPSERAEADLVVRTIDGLLGGVSHASIDSGRAEGGTGRFDFADFAVLTRTKAQMDALGEAFHQAGMPVQRRTHSRLLDHPGIAALVERLPAGGGPLRALIREAAAATLLDDHAIDLLDPLAERCGDDLDRFRTELALGAEVDTWDPRADRISLLTLHAAKGLEFPVVFIVGCEDGLLPLRWGQDCDLAEERRLLFVGMTRARSRLFLTSAHRRARRGTVAETIPSPFLRDIDRTLIERLRPDDRPRAPRPRQPRGDQLQLL